MLSGLPVGFKNDFVFFFSNFSPLVFRSLSVSCTKLEAYTNCHESDWYILL